MSARKVVKGYFDDNGVWHRGHVEVECGCGGTVYCFNFTNPCDCGADYNHSGHRLAPREQWGEETGEHWSDCF